LDYENRISFNYEGLDEAFPPCGPGIRPYGSRVIVQIRTAKKKTKGGILIIDDVRDSEQYNTQVGKVVAIGPLAYHNRNTMEPWPEGAWAKIGDFVRVPKYGGDRWERTTDTGESALFVTFNDLDLVGEVDDPLTLKAFL
jgi:co-chaperonin GroES (HSP10)